MIQESKVALGGVPMQVILYFARNPEEELLAADIAEKWGCESDKVSGWAVRLINLGWLVVVRKESRGENVGGRCHVYGAGPALLAAIGIKA